MSALDLILCLTILSCVQPHACRAWNQEIKDVFHLDNYKHIDNTNNNRNYQDSGKENRASMDKLVVNIS